MKTYAETQCEAPFDWNEFLSKPFEEYTKDNLEGAKNLSREWATCACGNQCDIIPRFPSGAPIDMDLNGLGLDFMTEIRDMLFAFNDSEADSVYKKVFEKSRQNAIEILDKIETRARILIIQIIGALEVSE